MVVIGILMLTISISGAPLLSASLTALPRWANSESLGMSMGGVLVTCLPSGTADKKIYPRSHALHVSARAAVYGGYSEARPSGCRREVKVCSKPDDSGDAFPCSELIIALF